MDGVELTDYASLGQGTRDAIAKVVSAQTSLERVLNWGRSLTPPRDVEEILTQDEYTHDVVLHYDEDLYLVYDTT
jgi:hypothetical protein